MLTTVRHQNNTLLIWFQDVCGDEHSGVEHDPSQVEKHRWLAQGTLRSINADAYGEIKPGKNC